MAKRKRTAPPLRRMIALNGGSAPFAHSVAKSRFCVSPFPPNRNGLRVGSRVRADSRNVVFRFAEMMGKEANFRVFGARREGGSEGAFFSKMEKGRRRTFGGRKGEKSKGRFPTRGAQRFVGVGRKKSARRSSDSGGVRSDPTTKSTQETAIPTVTTCAPKG